MPVGSRSRISNDCMQAAVDQLFADVAALAAPGSLFHFDFLHLDVLEGRSAAVGYENTAKASVRSLAFCWKPYSALPDAPAWSAAFLQLKIEELKAIIDQGKKHPFLQAKVTPALEYYYILRTMLVCLRCTGVSCDCRCALLS